jgi:hypothetical protein
MKQAARRAWTSLAPMVLATLALAYFFAWIEINIEGPAGWASSLPTWRIEQHWLLDIFWGSRPMTGYHAWVFPFIFLFFHFPLAFFRRWSWRLEMRVLACVALFWLVEDFLWFVLNPAWGLARFAPQFIPWHKHWIAFAPLEYWLFAPACVWLLWCSLPQSCGRRCARKGLPT